MTIIQQRSAQPDYWPVAVADITDEESLTRLLADRGLERLLVSPESWQQHQSILVPLLSSGRLEVGLQMPTEFDVTILDQSIQSLSLIKIVFAGFNDGRGFSTASILRNQLGYAGELRGVNVVKENLAMLEQCGFDAFEMVDGTDIDQAIKLFDQLKPVAA